tara:strand:- start:75 stop:1457 length:1383 start_codon:yes stop_codon:yes gene_type:complete
MESVILGMYNAELIKIYSTPETYITLKNGTISPIYFNLRNISTNPILLDDICYYIHKALPDKSKYDVLCGIPYGGIHYATYTSIIYLNRSPYLMKRKETKKYGLKNIVDGKYSKGERCILIEDVITTGTSVLSAIKEMEQCGINIVGIIGIVDRCHGGIEMLRKKGYQITALMTIHKIISVLQQHSYLSHQVINYIHQSLEQYPKVKLSYQERLKLLKNPLAKDIFQLMYQKQTNIALSLDIPNKKQFLEILEQTAPHICILKTHINIIRKFDMKFIRKIQEMQSRHYFVILEDGKFSDIGNTFRLQLTQGIYKINNWADSVTAHGIAGKSVLDVYRKENENRIRRGITLVAQMSNQGNHITDNYTSALVSMVNQYPHTTVMGFVTQKKIAGNQYLYLTPGVSLSQTTDDMDQNYRNPAQALLNDQCDILIVGRAIYQHPDPKSEVIRLKEHSWNLFLSS